MAKTEVPEQTTKSASRRLFSKRRQTKPSTFPKLPSVWSLLKQTLVHIWQNKRTFLGVLAVYLVLNLVFVKGFASTIDITGLKSELMQGGTSDAATVNIALLSVLFGSGNNPSSEVGSLYQSMILVISTLAFIWLFRHTNQDNDKKLRIRQPFYEGMTPLVPFILVLCVVFLQLTPMLAGLGILSTVLSNGLASTFIEQVLWSLLALGLTVLTFYLISSSVIALVIVTLPDTKPVAALRGARKVAAHRRWVLMRKIFLMTILLSIAFSLIVLLSIALVPAIAEWFFVILSALVVPVVIGFIYKLYRALL